MSKETSDLKVVELVKPKDDHADTVTVLTEMLEAAKSGEYPKAIVILLDDRRVEGKKSLRKYTTQWMCNGMDYAEVTHLLECMKYRILQDAGYL